MKSAEEKFIQKVVELLGEDSTIQDRIEGRVYGSHISSISNPSFPAISIFLLESKPRFECPELIDVFFQVDSWFPAKTSTAQDVLDINAQIRTLLHRANLTDSVIGTVVQIIEETSSGPMMFEDDTDLFHYPKRYRAVIK